MKNTFSLLFLICVLLFTTGNARTKITEGYILISGTQYNTSEYQSYLEFNFKGTRLIPRILYNFVGNQRFSVYQDIPARPDGSYILNVKMPYTPDAIFINKQLVSPTWYSDSTWEISSSSETPKVTNDSPEFVNTYGEFNFVGRMVTYGTANIATRVRGTGTSNILFQKIDGRYFLRQVLYTFGDDPNKLINTK